ncbi:hypothetical protein [Salinispora cortesiana]|uniref:hypothetical protein n=1 Tax=Salinispora cortesiana TaxID=1305843 RepID=UPI000415C112|nr:hypothetical protein [Salinispora cortesiana]
MTAPTPATPLAPYTTLLGFTRYVDRTGPTKATFVGGLRRQRASRSGFNPHGQFVKALKADIAFHTSGTHLDRVVAAVKPRWRPLYQALVPGAMAWLLSLGAPRSVDLAQTRDALALLGDLPVKINPHFGIRYAAGRAEAVRLHFDEAPPSDEAVLAMLHLMGRQMEAILPHAEPVLVDVRRGRAHRTPATAKPAEIERWLAGEAVAFQALWSTAA